MKRAVQIWMSLALFFSPLPLFGLIPAYAQAPQHEKIALRGNDGSLISGDSKVPYSPRRTCGACHDYGRITNGYHFQQGRTDAAGRIVVSDAYDPKLSWNLSSGMYGRYSPSSPDASRLAPKANHHSSDIDKSAFYFVQNCGGCHPGGAFGEYDRKGNLYYNEEAKKWGYELSEDNPALDGDYTSVCEGNGTYGSPWDKSGGSEADCLICHLKGYQWKERGVALKGGFFKHGPSVGAGWATVKLAAEESGSPRAEEVTIDYSRKEVADSENLHLQIVRKTPDDNCWSCHSRPDGMKTGLQWTPETDAHRAKGLSCISCHPGDKEHNFAKGNAIQQSVRNDLDNSMFSCEDCHYRRKARRAPSYRHPFSPRHMKLIACETCHIPFLTSPADLVYDDASTGSTVAYDTARFLAADAPDPKRTLLSIPAGGWYPEVREFRGKIVPVRSLIVIYWGDLEEKTNAVKPIPLWKIRGMKLSALKDDDGDGTPEVNTFEEIKSCLVALKGNDRFGSPIARNPVLMKGGFLYRIDKKGEVEKIKHDQADPMDYSLSHDVFSGSNVIGARGCKDCHASNSPFFLRKTLVDPYDEKGKPVYVETWERLGYDRDKLARLLLEQ